jgi:hypothetical protein
MSRKGLNELTFYRTIFPEELYLVPDEQMVPIPPEVEAQVVPTIVSQAEVPPAAPPEPAPPPMPTASVVEAPPSNLPMNPAETLSPTVAQQSKGDGSGAIIVQRLPKATFAKLRDDEFWQKFLTFLKLDWPTVRFVNVLTPEPLPLEALRASVPGATTLLLFGEDLVAPLPPTLPTYKVIEGKTLKVLKAHAVAELDDERKRALMVALKSLMVDR